MKLGIYLDLRNPDAADEPWPDFYARALTICQDAEAKGADSVWFTEHHGFADGYLPQPLTFAAAVAARTARMRIGTAILLAPLRHPAHIAEEAAVVDLLSDGRLDLGLGAGYRKAEFDLFDAEHERPLGQLFSIAEEVRTLLADGTVTPAPAQERLPIWLGCNGPKGAYQTGLAGERLLSANPSLATDYQRGLERSGHDLASGRMAGPVNIFVSEDPDRDKPVVAAAYAYLWDTYNAASVEGTNAPVPRPVRMDGPLARGLAGGQGGLLVATPEQAANAIRDVFDGSPVDTIFSWAMLPGVPHDLMRRHVELWSSVVGPAVSSI